MISTSIGGFALGLILGMVVGVCLYREAYDFFQRREAMEEKHREHLERVREFERRTEEGRVEAYVR